MLKGFVEEMRIRAETTVGEWIPILFARPITMTKTLFLIHVAVRHDEYNHLHET